MDSLEQIIMDTTSQETLLKALLFVEALRLFHHVEGACFGQLLEPNYKDCIKKFMAAYRSLGISIPLKVKIFNTRFIYWRHMLRSSFNLRVEVAGLGFWSK